MEIGDVMVCTSPFGALLTRGKEYKVQRNDPWWVYIIQDDGETEGWNPRYFRKKVHRWR